MTPKLPNPITDDSLKTVRQALEDLQTERKSFETFVHSSLDVLEELRQTLVSQDEEISQKSSALTEKESGLNEALEQLEAKAAEGVDYEAQIQKLHEETAQLKADRDGLRKKLETATEELASMASLLEIVEHVEEELQQTKAKLEEARDELAKKPQDQTEDELRKLRRECSNLEQESSELKEALKAGQEEIDRLKRQAAEQSDELNSYRKKWLGELADMKEVMSRRSHSLGEREESVAETTSGEKWSSSFKDPWEGAAKSSQATSESSSPGEAQDTEVAQTENPVPTSSDPVIGSVLSQLAKLEDAEE